ncbi:unnamed protein product [Mycena citricolor]|uniref:Cytochrome P450 n=1 Tax=Mycena citricolor TaxID=2018698 RepID=A0AAD2HIU6_9AGAR|nr:unnamed protein product [Mycena citricolor]
MSSLSALVAPVAAGIISLVLARQYLRKSPAAPLPPGPRGLPIIGNVLDMPATEEWLTFAKWGAQFGGLCSVKLLGQPIVVVNTVEAMNALDAKGSVFNTRPRLPMAGELVGYNKTLVLSPYGPRFRVYRKHFAKLVGMPQVKQFISMTEQQTHKLLKRLLTNPESDKIDAKIRMHIGSIILRITYGIDVAEEGEDPFVALIEHANDNFNLATAPGAFLVDVFPSLLYIPEFLAPFKRLAKVYAKSTTDMVEIPYKFAADQVHAGTAPVSFVSSLLEGDGDGKELGPQDIADIKYTASSLYGGGADTTAADLYAFFLAMVQFPEVQTAAQAEIDAVIGDARLPTYEDKEQLPYIRAVVSELLRWHSIAPLGVPHCAIDDAVVDGYLIPKGTIIITNIWQMMHDPAVYPSPETFDPTRFLGENPQQDPRVASFGWGRRICPGRELAELSLFHTVVCVLATFSIERAPGELPVHKNLQGTISHTKPFDCIIKPRSERSIALISDEA